MTLNGKYFEVGKAIRNEELPACSFRSVNDVYKNPSATKQEIFCDWLKWFIENGGYCGVASFNSMIFTIDGLVNDSETGKEYYCHITPTHNYCYEVV